MIKIEEKEIMYGWDLLRKIYNKEITSKDKVYLINLVEERCLLSWEYGLLQTTSHAEGKDVTLNMFDLINYKFEVVKSNDVREKLLLATECEKLLEAVNKFVKVAKESGFYK